MGEISKIAWTDATFNPWWGCTRVSPGCEHCYAEQLATVRRKLPVWGVDAERKPMSEAYWREPLKWDRKAEREGVRRRVFCASMADVFEIAPERNERANDVMRAGRVRLWELIARTPNLDWLLLTKRPENIERLAWWSTWPRNVWLGVTAEDQRRYDDRWPILARTNARVRFISHEPAIGPLTLKCRGCGHDVGAHLASDQGGCSGWFPDWVITGGESGRGARPYRTSWARDVVTQCRQAGIAAFVKQLGAQPVDGATEIPLKLRDPKGGDPEEWPFDLRAQEVPT